MKKFNFTYAYFIIGALLCSCNMPAESKSKGNLRGTEGTPTVATTPKTETVRPASELTDLCKQLAHIKQFPGRDPSEQEDPFYAAIMEKGKTIMPCLIDEIINETPMHDPRSAPIWQHYKVGDTAVFLLVDIAKNDELLEQMLPQPFRKEWKTNGVYAYFNYVSEPQNRKELQLWWKKWVQNNSKVN
ncbi:MAG: hypothetical protein ACKVQW_08190 [Pyrinomonadaceae bacterium]